MRGARGVWGWLRRRRRLGLRARVSLTFGLLAVILAVLVSGITWVLVSRDLLATREASAAVETGVDRQRLEEDLAATGLATAQQTLDAIPRGDAAASLLHVRGTWYVSTRGVIPSPLPRAFVKEVGAGTVASQRVDFAGHGYLVVGAPLTASKAAFFEAFPLGPIEHTLAVLAASLIGAGVATGLVGVALGRVVSRRALRPLNRLTGAAAKLAGGDLATRVELSGDPDLDPLADAFNRTSEALEKRVQADARFAADVGHELRTPLTSMLNSVAVVKNRRGGLPAALLEPVDLLAEDVEHFRSLVVDLLEMTRDDAGDNLVLEPVVITDLVRKASARALPMSAPRVDGDAGDLVLVADKRRLSRVVANLVANADGHGGGCTGVGVNRTASGVRITVDDGGSGVREDLRERVFERFSRGATTQRPGSGLGLAIVRRHVELHDGTVSIESSPAGGARFVVDLPRHPGPP